LLVAVKDRTSNITPLKIPPPYQKTIVIALVLPEKWLLQHQYACLPAAWLNC